MKFSVLKAAFLYAYNRNTCTPGVVMRILGFYKDKIDTKEFLRLICKTTDDMSWRTLFDAKQEKPSEEDFRVFTFCVLRGSYRLDDIDEINDCINYVISNINKHMDWEIKRYISDTELEMSNGYQSLFCKWSKSKFRAFNDFLDKCHQSLDNKNYKIT